VDLDVEIAAADAYAGKQGVEAAGGMEDGAGAAIASRK
jgi:hypothetical protein